MSGTTITSAGLDARRKRMLFRAWHRGTREMDLLLGQFADTALGTMSPPDLDAFEILMEVPDQDIFAWITGNQPVPDNYNTQIFQQVVAYHQDGPQQ